MESPAGIKAGVELRGGHQFLKFLLLGNVQYQAKGMESWCVQRVTPVSRCPWFLRKIALGGLCNGFFGRNVVSKAQGFTISPASPQFHLIALTDLKTSNALLLASSTVVKIEGCREVSAITRTLSTSEIPLTTLPPPPMMSLKY